MDALEWIFCHRGLWTSVHEQNSVISVNNAFKSGYAVEIDLYSVAKEIYVGHKNIGPIENLELNFYDITKGRVAINIKSDGLFENIEDRGINLNANKSFYFDGSIPEMFKIRNRNLPHALRISEFELDLPWKPNYIWIDGFVTDWWLTESRVNEYINEYEVIIVSPEIHKREPFETWEWIYELRNSGHKNISICTDYPNQFLTLSGDR